MNTLQQVSKKMRLEKDLILQAAVVQFLESNEEEKIQAVQRIIELQIRRLNHEGTKKG